LVGFAKVCMGYLVGWLRGFGHPNCRTQRTRRLRKRRKRDTERMRKRTILGKTAWNLEE
jgi:hypothetical protein